MKREIKFRAWTGEKMVQVEKLTLWPGSIAGHCVSCGNHHGASHGALMQFTGFRDKTGKEIYEGDILATSNDGSDGCYEWESEIMGAVEWDECSAGFIGVPERSEESIYDSRYVTVIGNIYETPELLTK